MNEINGRNGDTALHCASRHGNCEVVDVLLKANANINSRNARLETPLFVASENGRYEVVYLLLKNNANRNLTSDEGKDALFIASERDHKHVVALLKTELKYLKDVKAQVDVDVRNRKPSIPTTEQLSQLHPGDLPPPRDEEVEEPPVETKKKAVLIPIEVPKDVHRTHDPLTGQPLPPCKTMSQDEPAAPQQPLPAKARPAAPAYGGTVMAVGTGTGEKVRQKPPLVDTVPGGDAIDFEGKKKPKA